MSLDESEILLGIAYAIRNILPDTEEVDVNLTAERPLEQLTKLKAFGVITFVHVVRKGNLLEVMQRQQANLSINSIRFWMSSAKLGDAIPFGASQPTPVRYMHLGRSQKCKSYRPWYLFEFQVSNHA